jgi:hypothetical protein
LDFNDRGERAAAAAAAVATAGGAGAGAGCADGLSPPSDSGGIFDSHCFATTPSSSNGNCSDMDLPHQQQQNASPTSQLLMDYEEHLRNTLEKGLDAESYSLHTFESLLTRSMENLGEKERNRFTIAVSLFNCTNMRQTYAESILRQPLRPPLPPLPPIQPVATSSSHFVARRPRGVSFHDGSRCITPTAAVYANAAAAAALPPRPNSVYANNSGAMMPPRPYSVHYINSGSSSSSSYTTSTSVLPSASRPKSELLQAVSEIHEKMQRTSVGEAADLYSNYGGLESPRLLLASFFATNHPSEADEGYEGTDLGRS